MDEVTGKEPKEKRVNEGIQDALAFHGRFAAEAFKTILEPPKVPTSVLDALNAVDQQKEHIRQSSLGATLALTKALSEKTQQIQGLMPAFTQMNEIHKGAADMVRKVAQGFTMPQFDLPKITPLTIVEPNHDLSETVSQIQRASAEKYARQARAEEAQIKSAEHLAELREENKILRESITIMSNGINAILTHELKKSELREVSDENQQALDSKRHYQVMVGTGAAVISVLLMVYQILITSPNTTESVRNPQTPDIDTSAKQPQSELFDPMTNSCNISDGATR